MRRIGLFFRMDDPFREQNIKGVIDHLRTSGKWLVWQHWGPLADTSEVADFLAWKPDGALIYDRDRTLLDQLRIPCLLATGSVDAHLRFDEERIGVLAAEHLLGTGLRLAAVPALDGPIWEARRRGFVATMTARGAHVYDLPIADTRAGDQVSNTLITWIKQQYQPVGVFTLNDYFALRFISACITAGIHVPQQVAVIGADDLSEMCELSPVPITSVRIPHRLRSRRAAEQLDQLLDGKPLSRTPDILPPLGVAVRSSTLLERIDDREVATVLRLATSQVHEGLTVDDLVAACGVSRRTLEQRLRTTLGSSILAEIHRARIHAAEQLLAESSMPITTIASRTGWGDLSRFNRAFRKATGLVPGMWRKAHHTNQPRVHLSNP